jgi:hypothetical protein
VEKFSLRTPSALIRLTRTIDEANGAKKHQRRPRLIKAAFNFPHNFFFPRDFNELAAGVDYQCISVG